MNPASQRSKVQTFSQNWWSNTSSKTAEEISSMNGIVCLLLVLLLTSVRARSIAKEQREKNDALRRLMKAKKGGGKRGLKGSKGSKGGCETMIVYYEVKQLKDHSKELEEGKKKNSTAGYTIDELPIYYMNGKKAGFLTEANIVTGDDCTYTGVFSFDTNKKDKSSDQIFYQGKLKVELMTYDTEVTPLTDSYSFCLNRIVRICSSKCNYRWYRQLHLCFRYSYGRQEDHEESHPNDRGLQELLLVDTRVDKELLQGDFYVVITSQMGASGANVP
jgi:hypothetical protein